MSTEKELRAGEENTGSATSRNPFENCIPGHINLYPQLKEVQIHKTTDKIPKFELLNLNLSIAKRIRDGQRPSQIARELGMSKTALQYHLNQLKAAGIISKVGYGVWEVNISDLKEVQITSHVAHDKIPKFELLKPQPDTVRGHAFVFVLKVPSGLRNWNNRRRQEYLDRAGITYRPLGIKGGGQRIFIDGRKVWLTDSSIVIYEKSSYFAATASDAKESALASFLALVKKLERQLEADFTFRVGKEYRFKVSRQHYALVRNALAEQYDHEGKQLQVREQKTGSLWFVIDNSFNLHEAETVHPVTAASDNEKIQAWFNSLKACPVTADQLTAAIMGNAQNHAVFAENERTHIKAVQDLGAGVQEMNRILARLEEKLGVAP